MSRTTHHNLAARMGRWSADHWKTATFGWLAFVVAAFALGMAGTKSIDPNAAGPRESGRMDRILDAGFDRPAEESVLVQSRTLSASDPSFAATIEDVVARLSKLDVVQNVRTGQVSPDGRSALVEFEISGPADEAAEKIDPVLAQVEAAQKAHPQLYVGEFGMASAVDAIATTVEKDLGKAGMLSLPITLVILVIAFGALVAAGIPLLLALTAVFATFGIVAGTSHVFPMANEAGALVLLIGLAVGVDYSLFYLKREREERAAGRSERAALEAAAATSGRSVLVSGLTVMTAMAGMFLTGDPVFESFAIATIAVVAVAMIGSLTVLPALLSRLGDGVDRGRVPLVRRLRRDDGESRIWGAIVRGVLRRPLLSAVLAGGLLVALALPALQLRMVKPGPETFPQSIPAVQTYERMQQAFPGSALPADVVVKSADVRAPAMQTAIRRLRHQALASGRMHEPITVDINDDGTVANIAVPIDGMGTDSVSNASLAQLRDEIVPATVGAVPGAEAGVTGATAQWKDSTDEMTSNLPIVVGFVLLLAFSLMLVAFRSPVIAVKAIVLNLLSVAAAYGVLVLVFQHGYGSDLLGFTPTGGIDPVVPLLLFVILFGLSMDYHVFLLSRIREAVQRGASTEEAVARGITSTAGVVTSAAIVMVGVFAVFVTLSMLMFKQFGVGLAIGDPDRCDDRPRRAAARVDDAAGRLELVPAALAPVAAPLRAGRVRHRRRDSLAAAAEARAAGSSARRDARHGAVRGRAVPGQPHRRDGKQARATRRRVAARTHLRVRDRQLHARSPRRRATAGNDAHRGRARRRTPARQGPGRCRARHRCPRGRRQGRPPRRDERRHRRRRSARCTGLGVGRTGPRARGRCRLRPPGGRAAMSRATLSVALVALALLGLALLRFAT